jgi:hypothetical protein
MKARVIKAVVGVAIALTVICLTAWCFLLVSFVEHPNVHPFFLRGLSEWSGRRLPALLVVAMFWLMPVWIVWFAMQVRTHWRLGKTGLAPALLMNASSIPVLAAVALYLVFSGT